MRRWVGAGLLVGLPSAIALVLFFGGGQVRSCLGGSACGPIQPTSGPLDEAGEVLSFVIVVGVAWFALAALTIRQAWAFDRRRLRRATLGAGAAIVITGFAVGLARLADGHGRRVVVEDAGLFALAAACVAIPLALAWMAVAPRRT